MHWPFIAQNRSTVSFQMHRECVQSCSITLRSKYVTSLSKECDSVKCSIKICALATPTHKWWLLRPSPSVGGEEPGLGLTLAPSPVTVLLIHESWLLFEVCGAVLVLAATVDKKIQWLFANCKIMDWAGVYWNGKLNYGIPQMRTHNCDETIDSHQEWS